MLMVRISIETCVTINSIQLDKSDTQISSWIYFERFSSVDYNTNNKILQTYKVNK